MAKEESDLQPTLQMDELQDSSEKLEEVKSKDNSAFENDEEYPQETYHVGVTKNTEHDRKPDIFSKAVEAFWKFLDDTGKKYKTEITRTALASIGILYLAYFVAAIVHYENTKSCSSDGCYMEWCDGFGMLVILTVLVAAGLLYYKLIKRFFGKAIYKNIIEPWEKIWERAWNMRVIRLVVYAIPLVALVVFLVLDTSDNRNRLISFVGLIVLMLLGFVFSKHPGKIRWRPVFWGLALQFIFGLITIRWSVGRQIFQCIGDKLTTFLNYTNEGSSFVYGTLLMNENVFAFKVLSVIFFLSLVVQILYYWGAMQWVVLKLGWLLQVSMGTTVCESVNAAASIFLGISESPLLIKPYIKDLTHSELHAIMTAGFATVAGTVLAAYINFGVQASHILTASIMSAPAALCYAKLFYPETEPSKTKVDNIKIEKGDETSVLDAATKGAIGGIALVLGIIANIIAFVSVIAFLDGLIQWLSAMVLEREEGDEPITFQWILGKVFIPLVWLMGVSPDECEKVARLVGIKTVINEFVAYEQLGEMKRNQALSPRAEAIATYALCGFSNPGSIGILIGSLTTMAPDKRSVITAVAMRAFLSGCAVCFLTACIAGILISDSDDLPNSNSTEVPGLNKSILHISI